MPDGNGGDEGQAPNATELISLSQAAKRSGLSPSHLRLLVSQGTVWGMKLGRNWVTTEAAVMEYMARDRRPGPKGPRKKPDPPDESTK